MAKSKRNRRAQNQIAGSLPADLSTPASSLEPVLAAPQVTRVRLVKSSLFTAEFEEVIEIIARERVYRAMLARLAGRLLSGPTATGDAANY